MFGNYLLLSQEGGREEGGETEMEVLCISHPPTGGARFAPGFWLPHYFPAVHFCLSIISPLTTPNKQLASSRSFLLLADSYEPSKSSSCHQLPGWGCGGGGELVTEARPTCKSLSGC